MNKYSFMKRSIIFFLFSILLKEGFTQGISNKNMTPEDLWKLGRVAGLGMSKDGRNVIYDVGTPIIADNKYKHEIFSVPVSGGASIQLLNSDSVLRDKNVSPDGKYVLSNHQVKLLNNIGADIYPELSKSNAYIFDNLNYRHWDKWNTGSFDHLFISPVVNAKNSTSKDIMPGEPFDCPQKPFGGEEDYTWSPDSKNVVYVSKKKYGKDYALSTNTDLYQYNIASGKTINLTAGLMGYDINPSYSKSGTLAWLSMKRDGFEADKQDIYIFSSNNRINITENRDDLHVEAFKWSIDGQKIYFLAPVKATEQLFEVVVGNNSGAMQIRQVTKGEFQIADIIGESNNTILVSRIDFNHGPELYAVSLQDGSMRQLTHVNDNMYNTFTACKTELRSIKTTDGLQMPAWVVYPPNFDPSIKYPTLLFCLGGPQGNTPMYSFRWNFQLIASQGYIVIAPDRRGVFGNGTKWSQQISRDWGGQAIKDYLSATDEIAKEKYVDKNRLGCVGASYGGYSVYMLAGMHKSRFKTFIAHDGLFDLKSWAGTTEELWFANWDIGLPYWSSDKTIKKNYTLYSPSNFVEKWNTPILIIQGGKDYRVPIEQGLQAFQAAQLKGIKSKLLYFPDENHWVSTAQNALVWQHEFFNWLQETLK